MEETNYVPTADHTVICFIVFMALFIIVMGVLTFRIERKVKREDREC